MREIENSMVVDWWWNEQEYGVPSRRRLKMEKQDCEEEEKDDTIIS